MNLPFNNQFFTQPTRPWGQGTNVNNQGPSHVTSATVFHAQNYQSNVGLLNDIENHLLGESQVVSSDDGTLRANVESMCSLLESTDVNPNYTASHSRTNYQFADSSTDQVMQNGRNLNPNIDGLYSQHVNWLPHQESNDTIVMEQAMNNSLSPFLFSGNQTSGEFF